MPLSVARLALLRHARTAWNRAGRIQGRTDEPLDDGARRHLARLRLPLELDLATVVSSPLRRARETAALISGRAPELRPELIEMDWGRFEGCRGKDLLADPQSGYQQVEHWGWDFRPPGGESPREVWQRVAPWLASAKGLMLVVTHIGVMRVLLARATGWGFSGPPPFEIKRDRLYRVDVAADGTLSFDGAPVRLAEGDRP